MFYYMTMYSFDVTKTISAPFNTYEEATCAMIADINNELHIDINENEWNTNVVYDAASDVYKIQNDFYDHVDTTSWFIFEM